MEALSTAEAVKRRVAEEWGVSVRDLTCPRRDEPFTLARHVAMFLMRRATTLSLNAVGREFGGRNHGTVLHAVKHVGDRRSVDPAFDAHVAALEERFRP
jgi:chromosomal replication initiator protein